MNNDPRTPQPPANLERHIEDVRAGIKAGRFSSEASVSQGIVQRLLDALSWPIYDTRIVSPQFSLEGRRVDFALCHPPGKPHAFVEVKQVGHAEGAERQLFEYAFHAGVPLAILTDGQEWNFFLPAEQGDYGERRVYKLDIVARDVSECAARLTRYLSYDAVCSGAALEAARDDYRDVARDRQIKAALPAAWARLIEEEDGLLLELVAECAESLCGYKPDLDTVARFIKGNVLLAPPAPIAALRSARPVSLQPVSPKPGPPMHSSSIGFVLNGQFFPCRNAIDVLATVFETLSKRDASFLDRFAGLPKHGNKRRYLARRQVDLWPDRPELASEHSRQLSSGWWLLTNHSRATIQPVIRMACEIAGLEFGKDLSINLGE